MSAEHVAEPGAQKSSPAPRGRLRRLWFPLVLVGGYWTLIVGSRFVELPYFFRFLMSMAAPALMFVAFSIWWWLRRSVLLRDRAWMYLAIVGGAFAIAPLTHSSLGLPQALMGGLPVVMTVFTLWALAAPTLSTPTMRWASLAIVALAWSTQTLIRVEGLDGDLKANLHLRWTPTAEEMFLANRPAAAANSAPAAALADAAGEAPLALAPGDWPAFRGANRDGVVAIEPITTDWNATPPRLLWKQRVGPAWSSMIVIGERLFTQEQRGEQEAVVCYDCAGGAQLWAHEDAARFYESVSGPGPRATPTFADGRIYTLGATGVLNVLDARTGRVHWSNDLKATAGAVAPLWGLSGSPLVTDGLVVVYGGGENQDNLLAFHVDTGERAWTAPAGAQSYSSPQLLTIAGVRQIAMFHDGGLAGFDPTTGSQLWQAGASMPGAPRPLQAHPLADDELLVGSLSGFSASVIKVSCGTDGWATTSPWECTAIKPEFSDFVVAGGYAYGFDGAIFCCLDLSTGKRLWKGGRYGRGQVLSLPNQALLLVLSETGETVLLAANPKQHQELCRFQAIVGKTWNHPVVAHGRLFVRNAEEMACYELAPASAK